jgi:hypothetical protein
MAISRPFWSRCALLRAFMFQTASINNPCPDFRHHYRGNVRIFANSRLGISSVPSDQPGLEVFATIERGKVTLYEADDTSNRIGEISLWRATDTRLSLRGDFLELYFGKVWQFT